jgi:hypothetical protein
VNSFAKHKAFPAKQSSISGVLRNNFNALLPIKDIRQGAEKAFRLVENATFFCKISGFEPVEIPADPAHLQNILERIWP